MIRSILSLATLAMGTVMSGQADAVTVLRDNLTHGTASCQAALPVFDGNIRKRPKAIANEGTSSAFITCDFDTINNAGSGFSKIGLALINRSGVSKTVNCTFVNGVYDNAFSPSLVRSVALPAAATPTVLEVTAAADNAGTNFAAPAVSCEIPAGVEIALVRGVYPVEVGA